METITSTRCGIDRLRVHIGGSWIDGDGELITVTSPSTGGDVAGGRASSVDQVERAVAAAATAFPEFARTSVFERAQLCHGVAKALRTRLEPMARDLALEQG